MFVKYFLPQLLGLVFLFSLFISPVFGSSLTLQSSVSDIGVDDEFPVDVGFNISAKDGTLYYLRGVFFLEGSTKYCGLTWNGSEWYAGPYSTDSGWTHFLEISTLSSSWSGRLKAKIDPSDAGCAMSADYHFKIQRFTSSGSPTFDTQNEQVVHVVIPTPTPTPLPTPTPTPTEKPTPTSKSTPTPTPMPPLLSKIPTPTRVLAMRTISSVSPSKKIFPTISISSLSAVLGTMSATPTKVATKVLANSGPKNIELFPFLLIISGMLLLASCGILIFKIVRKREEV